MLNSVLSTIKKQQVPPIISKFSTATTTDSISFELTPRVSNYYQSPRRYLNRSSANTATETKMITTAVDHLLPKLVERGSNQNSLGLRNAAVMCQNQTDRSQHMMENELVASKTRINQLSVPPSDLRESQNITKNSQCQENVPSLSVQSEAPLSLLLSNCSPEWETRERLPLVLNNGLSISSPVSNSSIGHQEYLSTTSTSTINSWNKERSHFRSKLADDLLNKQNINSTFLQPSVSRRKVQYRKTRFCPWYSSGRCIMGDNCNYAHSQSELRGRPDLTRTCICPKMESCTNPLCRFAHYNSELRATGAFFRTKICKFWQQGSCLAGVYCRHAHGFDQLRQPEKEVERKTALLERSSLTPHRHSFDRFDFQPVNDLCEQSTVKYGSSRTASILSSDSLQETISTHTSEEIALLDALAQLLLEQGCSYVPDSSNHKLDDHTLENHNEW